MVRTTKRRNRYKYDIFDFEVFQKRIKRKAKRERFFSIFTDYGHCVASTWYHYSTASLRKRISIAFAFAAFGMVPFVNDGCEEFLIYLPPTAVSVS